MRGMKGMQFVTSLEETPVEVHRATEEVSVERFLEGEHPRGSVMDDIGAFLCFRPEEVGEFCKTHEFMLDSVTKNFFLVAKRKNEFVLVVRNLEQYPDDSAWREEETPILGAVMSAGALLFTIYVRHEDIMFPP